MEGEKALVRYAQTYEAGATVFREGDSGDEMYVVRSGSVRISKRVHQGERTLGTLGPGEFFGEMALISGRPRCATATIAGEETQLLVLPPAVLETMLRTNLEIAVRMIRRLADRLAQADRQIQLLVAKDHHVRVATYFLARLEEDAKDFGMVPTTAGDVAVETGCTIQEVDEALRQLEVLGLVLPNARGGYSVLGRAGLSSYLGL